MGRKKGKTDSRDVIKQNRAYNERGTYGIIDESGEVVKYRRIKQLFRGSAAAHNTLRELKKIYYWKDLRVEKLK